MQTNAIEDFQPILNIAIRRMDIFNKSCLVPAVKSGETSYVCENDDFFDETGTDLADNKLFIFSEDKLKLADQIDILYENNGCKMPISKPLFLKQVLNYLGENCLILIN